MKRVAIIGGGISGLAAARYLTPAFETHVFERQPRIGGHTNTVVVPSAAGPLAIDTGFIVHNDRTYPNFCRLMDEIGVGTRPSDMSFAVSCPRTGFEYSSFGLRGFFAQPGNILSLSHWRLLREILRFNREAPALLTAPPESDPSLSEFLAAGRYSPEFIERYLIPMAAAVWSTSPEDTGRFPARTLVRFFDNHGLLGLNTHPQWKVIAGGSNEYLAPLTATFRDRIHTSADIASVTRGAGSVTLRFRNGDEAAFDHVVFACHGDEVLPLLTDPTERERDVFANFRTTRNETVLHTDSNLLPRRPAARASWNYRLGERGRVTLTYHMNRLQSLPVTEDYCVTLNATDEIDPAKILRRIEYRHPLYDHAAVRAQQRWSEVSGHNRTHYCGAYWFYGFHEDGVNSALRVARALEAVK